MVTNGTGIILMDLANHPRKAGGINSFFIASTHTPRTLACMAWSKQGMRNTKRLLTVSLHFCTVSFTTCLKNLSKRFG